MASLTHHHHLHHHGLLIHTRAVYFPSPKLNRERNPSFPSRPKSSPSLRKIRVSGWGPVYSLCCSCKSNSESESVACREEIERPPFDINLAVILAGFAFEAYWSPRENVGKREVDAADCKTVYLSGSFLREVYDGQLFVKLKKGFDFPAMDPWGTSDPYVVMQLDSQVVKSKIKWGTKSPTWNEELTLNIKQSADKNLEVAAWDANLVTPHKRMGNARLSLDGMCDGNLHEVLLELEGMGGGGKIQMEVRYKSYDELDEDKKWWEVPFVTEFLRKNGFELALEKIIGSEAVKARKFVQNAFGQLKSFNEERFEKEQFSYGDNTGERISSTSILSSDRPFQSESCPDGPLDDPSCNGVGTKISIGSDGTESGSTSSLAAEVGETQESDKHFWNNLADVINRNVVQKFGVPVTEKIKWDGFDLLNKMGSELQKTAEAGYIESGLATSSHLDNDDNSPAISGSLTVGTLQSSLPDIKKATQDILRQTDSILGALVVFDSVFSQPTKEAQDARKIKTVEEASTSVEVDEFGDSEKCASSPDGSVLGKQKSEEMKALFSTAESAMEAWAMLATSLGHPTFIKSEFEKLCFLDNAATDTQVAIWRDSARKRLVIAFRGTEQARWKDLRTDLMLAPAGLNPERIGGDFKQEVQVHSGFLNAYDSVRTRIMSLIKSSIGFTEAMKPLSRWHVYVTGHSLGGALATLLALELSSSRLVKHGAISVTMYNFGSPRVGNKRFVEIYNEKVKDSWRVVNHRDIIPTVPHLMGYCHVAQPIYLAAGNRSAVENVELPEDGYHADVIGESTPDIIISEFMKGEKELIEKLLQTEINIFRSIRDGTALMQHMEDFYYITLLENVRSNYQTVPKVKTSADSPTSIG